MTNYQESTVSGTSWKRCADITIRNPISGVPTAIFIEEKVIVLGDQIIRQSDGNCYLEFDPVAGSFPILDPSTKLPTGETATHQQLYKLLYSLYMQTALARDIS